MPERFRQIQHNQVFGKYEQVVYETPDEAGHESLPTKGDFGWQMPKDIATSYILNGCAGKNILDLGCGWGETITIPALENGANHVIAADITEEEFDGRKEDGTEAPLKRYLQDKTFKFRLTPLLIAKDWWYKPMSNSPSVSLLLGSDKVIDRFQGSLDMVLARHSLQFGSPETVMNVLDLVSSVLRPGGSFIGINFTPYTEYCYKYDSGFTQQKIIRLNEKYSSGEINYPGGYLNRKRGPLALCLKDLTKRIDFAQNDESSFILFDNHTLIGLLNSWNHTRNARGLDTNLKIEFQTYFSPDQISDFNKLVHGLHLYRNKENHLFIIRKTKAAAS